MFSQVSSIDLPKLIMYLRRIIDVIQALKVVSMSI